MMTYMENPLKDPRLACFQLILIGVGTYLDSILVVGCGKNLLNNELASPSDDARLISKVGVLKQNAIIFFMDADGILDVPNVAVSGGKLRV